MKNSASKRARIVASDRVEFKRKFELGRNAGGQVWARQKHERRTLLSAAPKLLGHKPVRCFRYGCGSMTLRIHGRRTEIRVQ